MQEKTYIINPIPAKARTWSWLKINEDSVTVSLDIEQLPLVARNLPKGSSLQSKKQPDTRLPSPLSGSGNIWQEQFPQDDQLVTIDGSLEEAVHLVLEPNGGTRTSNVHAIHALENSRATVILLITGGQNSDGFCATRTRIYAEKNSEITLVKLQLLPEGFNHIDETSAVCGENAKIIEKQVMLGGSHVNSGIHTDLAGNGSQFTLDFAYLCKDKQYLDMNHEVYHIGKNTVCNMAVDGTLMDSATKIYRGTIDLQNGSSGSDGNETEGCLVLSPRAINKSAPIILCGEDDVHGEHGATIGRLASDMLFYMQSRGIDERTAKMLLARGKIQAVISELQDTELQERIQAYVEEAFEKETNE